MMCHGCDTSACPSLQPDKLAILTAVAIRAGEPDAATLLAGDLLPGKQPGSSPAANGGSTTDGSSAMGSGSE